MENHTIFHSENTNSDTSTDTNKLAINARQLVLSGRVQGVGFRPFIYRLAVSNNLVGWVKNCVGTVEVHVQGRTKNLNNFIKQLSDRKPPLAEPVLESDKNAVVGEYKMFNILQSEQQGESHISVPTDLFLCNDCLAELNDPTNRRYQYPFINCTQCGPRYTLIRKLPYDRSNTTMNEFTLCPDCLAEYNDPSDRRFHAEPIACPTCGPTLSLRINTELNSSISDVDTNDDSLIDESLIDNIIVKDNETILKFVVDALHNGKVIAVKGIGGYHLMCDASNTKAIKRLREKKMRLAKPFAVMFPAPVDDPFKYAEQNVLLNATEKAFLLSPARPVLLVKKLPAKEQSLRETLSDAASFRISSSEAILSEAIAPGLNEIGIMLPYSPLHHLLLNKFSGPLIATSANISGEPVLTDNEQVEQRLNLIADAFLHHNRDIERPADDPVYRTIANKPRPVRLGRGVAPIELTLPFMLDEPVLAVGGHMKNTITLAWKDRAVISPHIGEMNSPRSLEMFENTINDLQQLYQTNISAIICDAHPSYTTTRWAAMQDLPVHKVFHHHAHASAAYYECNKITDAEQSVIMFAWDGVGYGVDETLWGGETFIGKPAHWQRIASMRPFYLAGADKAGRQPWRSAAALSWEIGQPYSHTVGKSLLLHQAWQKKINSPKTSSVGRIFDAAAAFTDVCSTASFEGQGPMMLEALRQLPLDSSDQSLDDKYIQLPLADNDGLLITDWEPMVSTLTNSNLSVENRSTLLHSTLAHTILDQAKTIRDKHNINMVSFCGGVFQNKVLTETAIKLLSDNNFAVCLPEIIPVNDAGISFGQIIEYGFKQTSS